ncbi:hypothetical protein AB0C52_03075 [Streptomyces sp. NPDC048717]|uniref:hypothetical protein n=1 Tax=Streptomyces sp. NPDC048717 TaxID=3154928 RepID=UPI0034191A65
MELRRHPFIHKLLSLGLPAADYVVAGSGPLLAHGLRDEVTDLDVVARGDAWKIATSMADPVRAPSGHGFMVLLFDGGIEIFDRWLPGGAGVDALIDSAEVIQGIPFCPLVEVLEWKIRSNREKDQPDIRAIAQYLRRQTRR